MLLYHIIQKHFLYRNYRNWDSVVGIETRYGLEGAGLETRRSKRFSLLHTVSVMSWGTHTTSCAMRTTSLSRVNRPRNGAENQQLLTLRFSMGTAKPLLLCIQCYVMLCYGMTFALTKVTYCATNYHTCTKLFENHTLGVTSVATTLGHAFETW